LYILITIEYKGNLDCYSLVFLFFPLFFSSRVSHITYLSCTHHIRWVIPPRTTFHSFFTHENLNWDPKWLFAPPRTIQHPQTKAQGPTYYPKPLSLHSSFTIIKYTSLYLTWRAAHILNLWPFLCYVSCIIVLIMVNILGMNFNYIKCYN